MMPRSIACAAIALALLAGGSGVAAAQTPACPAPPYPGDAAPREAIAQWMGYNAALAALPRELPVMAALVESDLQNLQRTDSDSVGYFQMRTSIWNQGKYAGFPQRPDLQLQWFIDQATAVRQRRIAAGQPDPAVSEADYGDWIADVETPADSLRGRYQLRLDEARALIGPACVPPAAPEPVTVSPDALASPPPAVVDTTPPVTQVFGARRQRALRRGAVVVSVACPAETCVASASATLRLPGTRRAPIVAATARTVPAGERRTLRVALRGLVRRRLRKALGVRASLAATVRLVVVDAAGNQTLRTTTVWIVG